MHPIAVHTIATTRVEELHREAASWRRRRGARPRRAALQLPVRVRTARSV